MNEKNSLGLNKCFLDLDDPFKLFESWYEEAKKNEINDPNALALGTATKQGVPSVRMVLLKGYDKNGFIFYTNLNSQKGIEIKENPNATMCFHWKSLLRQIRIVGTLSQVEDEVADNYFNSRAYESRIGAWASKQSSELVNREELIKSLEKFKNNPFFVINPDTVWSCFKTTVTSACIDAKIEEDNTPTKTARNIFSVLIAVIKPVTAPTDIIPSTPRLSIPDFSVINSPNAAMNNKVAACNVAFKRPIS